MFPKIMVCLMIGLCIQALQNNSMCDAQYVRPATLEFHFSQGELRITNVEVSIRANSNTTATLDLSITFESNSSGASLGWSIESFEPVSSEYVFVERDGRIQFLGYATSWASPSTRHYVQPSVIDEPVNHTARGVGGSWEADRETFYSIDYSLKLGEMVGKAQRILYSHVGGDVSDKTINVIGRAHVLILANCGVQSTGNAYFTDIRIPLFGWTEAEISISIPAEGVMIFSSSNLVRIRPNVLWAAIARSANKETIQRFYVEYDMTSFLLRSPTKEILSFLASLFGGVGLKVLVDHRKEITGFRKKVHRVKKWPFVIIDRDKERFSGI